MADNHYHKYDHTHIASIPVLNENQDMMGIIWYEDCALGHSYCKVKAGYYNTTRDRYYKVNSIEEATSACPYGAGHTHTLTAVLGVGSTGWFSTLNAIDCPVTHPFCRMGATNMTKYASYAEVVVTTSAPIGNPDGLHHHTFAQIKIYAAAGGYATALQACPAGHARCQHTQSLAVQDLRSDWEDLDTGNDLTFEVATVAASPCGATSATLNGLLDVDGGVTCEQRGFDWGETIAYGTSWTEVGAFGDGAFSHGISGLTPGQLYHFRAKSYDSDIGWNYGDDVELYVPASSGEYFPELASDIAGHPKGNCGAFDLVSNPSAGKCCWPEVFDCGVRFYDVVVPSGVVITAACLKLCVTMEGCPWGAGGTLMNAKIRGENKDSPATFTTEANYNARSKTVAEADWDHDLAGEVSTYIDTVDITSIVQEIIDRLGWVSGNYMTIFIEDDGSLDGFFGEFSRCPVLHIEYGLPTLTPLVLTKPATSVEELAATLRGEITDIGVDTPDRRGFDWGVV